MRREERKEKGKEMKEINLKKINKKIPEFIWCIDVDVYRED